MSLRRALVGVALALASCSPVLTPVEGSVPQALPYERVPPQVLWVLDTSGSMALELVPGGGLTRRAVILEGMSGFAARALLARHGLVAFPRAGSAEVCAGPDALLVAPPPTAPDGATAMGEVLATAQTLSPFGGTPTAAALRFAADSFAVDARTDNYLVLLTDGVPNCNIDNPNGSCTTSNPACRCTLTPATSCNAGSTFCAMGCLDDDATVTAAQAASQKGLLPLVVGVGSDVLGGDAAVLSSLQEALPPACLTDGDCRTGSGCLPDGTCAERFYAVQVATDIQRPMDRLAAALTESARCGVWLKRAVSPVDLQVFVDGVEVPPGLWSLTGGQRLRIYGDGCAQLKATDAALTFAWPPQ